MVSITFDNYLLYIELSQFDMLTEVGVSYLHTVYVIV